MGEVKTEADTQCDGGCDECNTKGSALFHLDALGDTRDVAFRSHDVFLISSFANIAVVGRRSEDDVSLLYPAVLPGSFDDDACEVASIDLGECQQVACSCVDSMPNPWIAWLAEAVVGALPIHRVQT